MPDPRPSGDRTPAQRQADHAGLARLSESLVPALVQKLASSGLGELEVREGDWRIRLRRASTPAAPSAARRTERPRLGVHGEREGRGRDGGAASTAGAPAAATTAGAGDVAATESHRTVVLSPAVGVFQPGAKVGESVRAGDRIAVVDLLGIAQDVTSPIDGTVVEVFPQAGEAVEYGEEVAAVASEVEVETDGSAGDEAPAPSEGSAAADAPEDDPASGRGPEAKA
jgi:acetyl-CoA carboxylase biotin carboxyl carrier protein